MQPRLEELIAEWEPRTTAKQRLTGVPLHRALGEEGYGVVALDDGDGRIVYRGFFEEEGTASTFAALSWMLREHGRFLRAVYRPGQSFLPH